MLERQTVDVIKIRVHTNAKRRAEGFVTPEIIHRINIRMLLEMWPGR